MDTSILKERLHEYIENADEQHLSAIYVLIEDKIPDHNSIYDEATMRMLYERREHHRNGTSKSYTVAESMEIIKNHRK